MDPKGGILCFVPKSRIAGGSGPDAEDMDFYGPTSFAGENSIQKISELEPELADYHLDIGKTFAIKRIRFTYWSIYLGGLAENITLTSEQFLLVSLNFKSPLAQTPAAEIKWTFANAATRMANGVFVAADIWKVAFQTDEESWWILTAIENVEASNLKKPTWESQDQRSQLGCSCIAWRPVFFFLPSGIMNPYRPYLNIYTKFLGEPGGVQNGPTREAKDQRVIYLSEGSDSRGSGFLRMPSAPFTHEGNGSYPARFKFDRGNLPFAGPGPHPDTVTYEEIKALIAANGPFTQGDIGRSGIVQPYSDYLFGANVYTLLSVDGDFTSSTNVEASGSMEYFNTPT